MVSIDALETFQGDLKRIDAASFEKLKKSILKHGFAFPIFVWRNNILDGHQRLAAVKNLIDEGHEIDGGKLPVVQIQAKNKKDAAEKLLLINSRYAKIDQDGFDFFVQDFDIDIADMSGILDIPEINFNFIETGDTDYNEEWDGMPEFEQEDEKPFHSIKVHFLDKEKLNNFSKLIGQEINENTTYIYHPKQIKANLKNIECGDES